jgi:ABC-type sugar transport system ATPase subunit
VEKIWRRPGAGAGKSTLIKNISGVFRPDRGDVYLEDQRVTVASPRESRSLGIETVYQDLALAGDLSVGANIFLGREPVRRLLGLFPFIDNRRIKAEAMIRNSWACSIPKRESWARSSEDRAIRQRPGGS